ncbi:MAG: peptidoglycan-binding domain-containing protein, partial [Chthoniobacteraceae bacterium]
DNTVQQKDREFLRREQQPPLADVDDFAPPAPRAPASGGGPYGRVFARTPYASAPLEVQQDTIRRAQRFLRELSFYRESIDGVPGPALEEGLLSYQRFIALPLTGQLDLETLAAMRLLPGRGGAPAQSQTAGKPLRGIWIK